MSNVTRNTLKYTTLWLAAILFIGLGAAAVFAQDPHALTAAPIPWWQRIEEFQNFALKFIVGLTTVVLALMGAISHIMAKIVEMKQQQHRTEERYLAMQTQLTDVAIRTPTLLLNAPPLLVGPLDGSAAPGVSGTTTVSTTTTETHPTPAA